MSWLPAVGLVACGAPAAPDRPPLAVFPERAVPGLVDLTRLPGLCDASAAVEVGGFLVVADDERDVLVVFDAGLQPAGTIDLEALAPELAARGEADLEGMTTSPDGVVWLIGSHDAGSRTEPRRERFVLVPLRLEVAGGTVTASLAGPVDASGSVRELVEAGTEGRTAKDEQGLSIEGLAFRHGALEVGFRHPVRGGRAAVVRLGEPPALRWVDLGGRGIRSMEDEWVVGGGGPGFALFRWATDGVEPVPFDFGDFTPEGLVKRGDAWWVVSDEGRRESGGVACKDLPADQRWTRIGRLAL